MQIVYQSYSKKEFQLKTCLKLVRLVLHASFINLNYGNFGFRLIYSHQIYTCKRSISF